MNRDIISQAQQEHGAIEYLSIYAIDSYLAIYLSMAVFTAMRYISQQHNLFLQFSFEEDSSP